jgi:hypothetical protein
MTTTSESHRSQKGASSVGLVVLAGAIGMSLAEIGAGGLSGPQGFAIGAVGSFAVLVTLAVTLKAATKHYKRDTGIQAPEEGDSTQRARTTEDTHTRRDG